MQICTIRVPFGITGRAVCGSPGPATWTPGDLLRQKEAMGGPHFQLDGLPGSLIPSEEPNTDRAGPGSPGCQPGACSSVRGHRKRDFTRQRTEGWGTKVIVVPQLRASG